MLTPGTPLRQMRRVPTSGLVHARLVGGMVFLARSAGAHQGQATGGTGMAGYKCELVYTRERWRAESLGRMCRALNSLARPSARRHGSSPPGPLVECIAATLQLPSSPMRDTRLKGGGQ